MSMNSKVRKIQSLKLAINREVWKREDALDKLGEENDKFFLSLKAVYDDIKAFFEGRAGRKAIVLHKRLDEALKAQEAVSK